MDYEIETRTTEGFKVIISYDPYGESPDSWGNTDWFLGKVSSKRYGLGREGWNVACAQNYLQYGEGIWDYDTSDYYDHGCDSEQELREKWQDEYEPYEYEVFPVELVDYGSGGAQLRFTDTKNANAYIYVSLPYSCLLSEVVYRVKHDFDPYAIAEGLLKTWNTYLEGRVYHVCVKTQDGEDLDSCGELYGEEETEDFIKQLIEHYKNKTCLQHFLVTRADMSSYWEDLEVPVYLGEASLDWAKEQIGRESAICVTGPHDKNKIAV